jgi:hypothetical protein
VAVGGRLLSSEGAGPSGVRNSCTRFMASRRQHFGGEDTGLCRLRVTHPTDVGRPICTGIHLDKGREALGKVEAQVVSEDRG